MLEFKWLFNSHTIAITSKGAFSGNKAKFKTFKQSNLLFYCQFINKQTPYGHVFY